jgi:hypothetical protein
MSSNVTGDAQPDAGSGDEADHTLPTEIVEKTAGAGVPQPRAGAEPAPDEPTRVLDAADDDGQDDLDPYDDGDWGPDDDAEHLAERSDPDEPTELVAMTEPVRMAEPVDLSDPAGPRRVRRRWQSALIALGFLAAAAAIIGGAIAIVGSLTHGFKKPVVIHYTKSAIFSLKTGQCIDPAGQTATIVSCSAPHDAEVFARFELPGSKWPGTKAVGAAASSGCSSRLSGYLNPQLAISLTSTYIYPDSVAWQAGTRTVICEVRATSGQLTGSVQGASATAG